MDKTFLDVDNEHDDVFAQLAWHANDTLPADQRARVMAHLARCAACRSEFAAIELSFEVASRVPAVSAAAIDAGWQRMLARTERTAAPPRAASLAGTRMRRWREAASQMLRRSGLDSSRGVVVWAGAAAALAVTTVVVLPMLGQAERDAGAYRVLTSAPGNDSSVRLRVKFKNATTTAQVMRRLHDVRADTSVQQQSASEYVVGLPPAADFQAVNQVFEHLARDAEVDDVQLIVPAAR